MLFWRKIQFHKHCSHSTFSQYLTVLVTENVLFLHGTVWKLALLTTNRKFCSIMCFTHLTVERVKACNVEYPCEFIMNMNCHNCSRVATLKIILRCSRSVLDVNEVTCAFIDKYLWITNNFKHLLCCRSHLHLSNLIIAFKQHCKK